MISISFLFWLTYLNSAPSALSYKGIKPSRSPCPTYGSPMILRLVLTRWARLLNGRVSLWVMFNWTLDFGCNQRHFYLSFTPSSLHGPSYSCVQFHHLLMPLGKSIENPLHRCRTVQWQSARFENNVIHIELTTCFLRSIMTSKVKLLLRDIIPHQFRIPVIPFRTQHSQKCPNRPLSQPPPQSTLQLKPRCTTLPR